MGVEQDYQAELSLLEQFEEKQLFDLCVELDFVPAVEATPAGVLPEVLERITERLASGPIPISKWDAQELAEQFDARQVELLARKMGVGRISPDKKRTLARIVRLSSRRCRELPKESPLRWMVPILLPAVVDRLD